MANTSPTRAYAIIGGGIGGLTLAYRLLRGGVDPAAITIYEANAHCGGLLRSTRRDGYLIEHGPDSILRSKPAGLALWQELGLSRDIVSTEPTSRTALIAQGTHLHPVPEGLYLLAPGKLWPLATTPLLSWRGKLRAACDLVLPRRPADAPEESLAHFTRRRFGRELFERIAQPLAGGIYTADPETLSLSATMPQFITWEREHRSLILAARARQREAASGPRYGLFASLRDGLQQSISALEHQLHGVQRLTNCCVRQLQRQADGWSIQADERTLHASHVAICGPAHMPADILVQTSPDLATACAAIPYAGAVIVNIAFPVSALPNLPTAAGFVVPAREGRQILAATFMSVKYQGRAPSDAVLLRIFLGGAQAAHQVDRSDNDILGAVQADLRDLLRPQAAPLWHTIDRWPASMAQYRLGHRERVAHIRTLEARDPTLALIGNGYEGVGIPDVIAQANTTAARWGFPTALPASS